MEIKQFQCQLQMDSLLSPVQNICDEKMHFSLKLFSLIDTSRICLEGFNFKGFLCNRGQSINRVPCGQVYEVKNLNSSSMSRHGNCGGFALLNDTADILSHVSLNIQSSCLRH